MTVRHRVTRSATTAAATLAVAAATSLTLVPSAAAADTAKLRVNTPIAGLIGSMPVWAGSIKVNGTCLPITQATTGGPGRMLASTDYQVTVGKAYTVSVWGGGCVHGPIGSVTETVRPGAISNGYWQVQV